MSKSRILTAGFILSAVFSVHAEAKLYKWVDDNGTTHYGEVIPPEYANKDRDSLNKAGLLDKRPEKVNPETSRLKEEADKKRKIENQATMDQQRRDSALLNTYSNETEIDMARDRSLSQSLESQSIPRERAPSGGGALPRGRGPGYLTVHSMAAKHVLER